MKPKYKKVHRHKWIFHDCNCDVCDWHGCMFCDCGKYKDNEGNIETFY